MPKANMYQSLHTTVIGPKGNPVEIQIRTHEMHEIAEFGVAAHWAYKEGRTEKVKADKMTQQVGWFREILELQDESYDASEFMEGVKGIFSVTKYMYSHRKAMSQNCLKVQVRWILPTVFIPISGTKPLVQK